MRRRRILLTWSVFTLLTPAASAAPPPDEPAYLILDRTHGSIERLVRALQAGDDDEAAQARGIAREGARLLAEAHAASLARDRLDAALSWDAARRASAIEAWERLADLERDPVRSDPDAITKVLADCRSLSDRWCEARAQLARAEALAQSGLPEEVKADTAAAEEIFRRAGPTELLGRTLVLRRGAGAGEGPAAAEKARERYAEAIRIAGEVGSVSLEGRALCERVRLNLGQREEEVEADLARLEEITEAFDEPRVATCKGYFEGLRLYFRRDPAGAARVWGETADAEAAPGAPRERLWNLVGASAASIDVVDGGTALARARQAVEVAAPLQGDDDRMRAFCNLTTALAIQGVFDEAEPAARTCLDLSRGLGSKNGEEIALRGLAAVARSRGDTNEALRLYGESLAITRQIRNPFDTIHNLSGLGMTLEESGRSEPAREAMREAVSLADWVQVPLLRAGTRSDLAWILAQEGSLDEAESLVEEALELLPEDAAPGVRAWALRCRALVHGYRQRHAEALTDLREAARLMEAAGHVGGQATMTIDLGNIYYRLYRLDRSLRYYEQALELATESGQTKTRLIAEGNLTLLRGRALSPDAVEQYERIIREAEAAGFRGLGLNLRINFAHTLSNLGRPEEAEQAARESVALAGASGQEADLGRARRVLARILTDRGRTAEALDLCRELPSDAHAGDPLAELDATWTCGVVSLRAGRASDAVRLLREAVRLAEVSRPVSGPGDLRATFLADRVALYGDLVGALVTEAGSDRNRSLHEEIFDLSESFRARALLESLAGLGAEESPAPASGRRADLLARQAQLHLKHAGGGMSSEAFLRELRQLEDLIAESGAGAPAAGGLLGADRIGLDEAQRMLPESTAALQYLLGGDASFVLVVTRDDVEVAELGVNRATLYEEVAKFRSLLESRSDQPERDLDAIRRLGGRLHALLVAPAVAASRGGVTRLLISPDGPLSLLPFEALVAPGSRFLVEDYEVAMVPSLTVLARLREEKAFGPPRGSYAALADPTLFRPTPDGPVDEPEGDRAFLPTDLPALPYSREEIAAIARHVGGDRETYTGSAATEANARRALAAGNAVVHFATHGFLDSWSIGRSGLVLTPEPAVGDDGLLQAREIVGLPVRADLVVLSGCSTGVGRIWGGEGVIGLPHSLFQAGVPSVMMSLWAVLDRAAALLMDRFYAGLAEGKPPGAALRSAKIGLLASSRAELKHPSVWASFVLAGDSGRVIPLPAPTPLQRLADLAGRPAAWLAAILVIAPLILWGMWARSRSAGTGSASGSIPRDPGRPPAS